MGYTLTEKILMKNTGKDSIKPGDLIIAKVDRVMVHDIFAPFVIEKFREMGFEKVWNPNKIVFVYDHLIPTSFIEDSRHHKIGDAFAAEQGIHADRSDGRRRHHRHSGEHRHPFIHRVHSACSPFRRDRCAGGVQLENGALLSRQQQLRGGW